MAERGNTLSKISVYEQLFKTRHRGSGRPAAGSVDDEPLFPAGDRHPLIVRVAQRRAYAVIHEENKARLRELFASEVRVLGKRGPEQVAADAGYKFVEVAEEDATTGSEA